MEPSFPDLSEVLGQETAKRALEIAAAGGHPILLVGPPGAGKTMLAERLPGLLPPLLPEEAAELAEIHARCPGAGKAPEPARPFRRPPPTISPAALIGGGRRLGEVSLAHHGILFLDDLTAFRPATLAALLQPLTEGTAGVSRPGRSDRPPARFLLIAAMNPCPCGRRLSGGPCRYRPAAIGRHLRAVTGTFLDRIHLHVEVPSLCLAELRSGAGESTATVSARVTVAREEQRARQGRLNAALHPEALRLHASPAAATGRSLLDEITRQLGLSARALANLLKVARTIADLGGSDGIRPAHLAEAAQYHSVPLGSLNG